MKIGSKGGTMTKTKEKINLERSMVFFQESTKGNELKKNDS